jgi:hypothetical protein
VALLLAAGCDQGGLKGAEAEVKKTNIQLDLPPVPEFEAPSAHPDGTHAVSELLLKGRKLFGNKLEVKGYVTWIYDCLSHKRKPGQTDKQAKKMIEEDPSLCDRPHFIMGDEPDTPNEKGIWVVEVPREMRKDELKLMNDDEIAALPPVPVFKIGDEVVVTGTWDVKSPKGFARSVGLVVYESMKNLTTPMEEPDKK